MLRIAQVGTVIRGGVEYISLSGRVNLSDFDIIFFDIQHMNREVLSEVNASSGAETNFLISQYGETVSQMKDFFEHGGIAISFLCDNPLDICKHIEREDIRDFHLLDFLHLEKDMFKFEDIEGAAFEYKEPLERMTALFDLRYRYTLESFDGIPVMQSRKKKNVVGIKKKVSNGVSYLLPAYERTFDLTSTDKRDILESIIKPLIVLNTVAVTESTPIPDWLDNYSIYNEQEFLVEKQVLIEEQRKLEIKIAENDTNLLKFQNLKRLIYAGDDDLEAAVEETFRAMGFNVSVPEGNNDDLHILEKDFTAVVEIKGVTKSGTTLHVMQLEKWASNYGLENEGELAKGILVLNPFRSKSPSERKENPFPTDMVKFSKARGHCLMLSEDLLNIYVDFCEKLIKKSEIQDVLSKTIGVLKYSPRFKIKT